ncbi:MAG: DUF4834 family protein [Bacteroidales bacterium]|nr:DUF4834 family protein [Bacteroidales bacterium]
MESFLLFIFWVIFIFYAFRLFLRYGLPWLLARYFRKMQRNMGQRPQNEPRKQEGEVKVKYKDSTQTRVDPDIGEYVDFEEIKDNNNQDESKK